MLKASPNQGRQPLQKLCVCSFLNIPVEGGHGLRRVLSSASLSSLFFLYVLYLQSPNSVYLLLMFSILLPIFQISGIVVLPSRYRSSSPPCVNGLVNATIPDNIIQVDTNYEVVNWPTQLCEWTYLVISQALRHKHAFKNDYCIRCILPTEYFYNN